MFPHLMQNPQQLRHFFNMLEGWRVDRTEWFDVYPVQQLLLENFDSRQSETLLVDIGGATGYDAQKFKRITEERQGCKLPGKVVVQDLPFVINDIKELDAEIVRMPYDFFTPQPVEGAKAYVIIPPFVPKRKGKVVDCDFLDITCATSATTGLTEKSARYFPKLSK